MKENDIKKAYENIKISETEKAKIYSNIMANKKKGFNWKPFFGLSTVALASFGIFMIADQNTEKGNSLGETNTIEKRNVALENDYSKQIIINARKYLADNKINVEEIENGKELIIEADKIVDNEEFKTCKGNLVITRYNKDFSYNTSVTCEGTDTEISNKKEYVIYDGILSNVFELGNGKYIGVASTINNVKENYNIVDCDANFTVFNKEGKVVFNKLIESIYKDENSTVELTNVNIIGEKYYLILKVHNNIHFNSNGSGSSTENYYLMTLDKDGNELSYIQLISKDGDRMFIDKYIGNVNDKNEIYYTGHSFDAKTLNNTFGIIKISKDNVELIPCELNSVDEKKEIFTHNILTSEFDGANFYGYSIDKSYGESNYYSARKIFKINTDGKKIWEKELDEGENIHQIEAKEDIYVLASNGTHFFLYKYNTEGERIEKKTLSEYDWVDDFDWIQEYNENNGVIVKGKKEEKLFMQVLNSKLEVVKTVELDNSDIDAEFEWKYLRYWKLNGDNINSAYSVSNNIQNSNSVLLVFNK